jgi:hypothetical protein
MKTAKIIFACLLCLSATQTAFGQTEKLGIIHYTAPTGWSKSTNENVVAFSKYNQSTGLFCIITVYGATSGAGKPKDEFSKAWDLRVVTPLQAEANPKTETQVAEGWTITAGGAPVDVQGSKSFAFLTVFSGFGKTASILGVFNDQSYMSQLAAFVASVELDKAAAASPPAQAKQAPPPPPPPAPSSAAMHVAALVKEFENNEVRANQLWVGKRVRIFGTVNSIEVGKDGNIILTFKSSVSTYKVGRCFFNKSQSSRVAAINAHQEATVEGTVRGFGGGFDNSKAFLLFEDCTVP